MRNGLVIASRRTPKAPDTTPGNYPAGVNNTPVGGKDVNYGCSNQTAARESWYRWRRRCARTASQPRHPVGSLWRYSIMNPQGPIQGQDQGGNVPKSLSRPVKIFPVIICRGGGDVALGQRRRHASDMRSL
jgi:hypothetical protein